MHGRAGWRLRAARFLERAGVLPGPAQQAIDRFAVGATVAATVVAVGTLVLALVETTLTDWRAPDALMPAMLLGLGAWVLVLAGQWLAQRRAAAAAPAVPKVHPVGALGIVRRGDWRRDPWPWGAQLGWSVLAIALEAAALAAALQGVGGRVPVLATVTVYAALRLLWSLVPVAGAPGAADIALLLALSALGAPLASACAAVVTFRLLTFWIPAGLGSLLSGGFEHRLLT